MITRKRLMFISLFAASCYAFLFGPLIVDVFSVNYSDVRRQCLKDGENACWVYCGDKLSESLQEACTRLCLSTYHIRCTWNALWAVSQDVPSIAAHHAFSVRN